MGARIIIALGGVGILIAIISMSVLESSDRNEVVLREATPTSTPTQEMPLREAALEPVTPIRAPSPEPTIPAPHRAPIHSVEGREPIEEAQLIERARRTLESDPRMTLGILRRHRRIFPEGLLTDEAAVLEVEARVRLGDDDAARAAGERFLRANPDSAYRSRIQNALGREPE
jgi:hypothetical protein